MTWMVAPSYAHATIKKVDENAHKAYIEEVCDKCGGSGIYGWFGTCFRCNGGGRLGQWVKAYTPEVKYPLPHPSPIRVIPVPFLYLYLSSCQI